MRNIILVFAWAALVVSGGCGGTQSSQQSADSTGKPVGTIEKSPAKAYQDARNDVKAPSAALDPCALHLHDDICPALLLYLASHANQLPPSLAELRQTIGDPNLDLTCPTSHQPYGYDPNGLVMPGEDARIIVADTQTIHGGVRWAIRIAPGVDGRPPTATVIPLTDELYSKLRKP